MPGEPNVSVLESDRFDDKKTGKSGVSGRSKCKRVKTTLGFLLDPSAVIVCVSMPCWSRRGIGFAMIGIGRCSDGAGASDGTGATTGVGTSMAAAGAIGIVVFDRCTRMSAEPGRDGGC